MKYNPQEALDILYDKASCECEVDEDTGELQMLDCTTHEKYLNMREPLQQFIDVQFTKEELNMIEQSISVNCNNDDLLYSIIYKCVQQKKMWKESKNENV